MSYGWLSETTLSLKKPKVIKISDKSNEPLRKIINEHLSTRDKVKDKDSEYPDITKSTESKSKSSTNKYDKSSEEKLENKGVRDRARRDKELHREGGYKRVLAKKAQLYDKLESGDVIDDGESLKILSNSLVDFRKKSVMRLEPASLPDGGAPSMYTTPNVIPPTKSNIDELRSKLAKIKQKKQHNFT